MYVLIAGKVIIDLSNILLSSIQGYIAIYAHTHIHTNMNKDLCKGNIS